MVDNSSDGAPPRRGVLQALGGVAGLALVGSTASTGVVATDDADDGAETNQGHPRYQLPELPYASNALEPHIDERIMELHHSEHHQSYVDGANEALEEFEAMRQADDFENIRAAKRDYSFNFSGHVNHTIFWQNMSPDGGGQPDGDLAAALEAQFGSFETFQQEFSATANEVEGDGWAMLFYEPLAGALVIGQVEDQHELAHQTAVPILTLDVWEHAYYLQYENDREAYVQEWWNVVDWADVSQRYELLTDADVGLDAEADSDIDPGTESVPDEDEPPANDGVDDKNHDEHNDSDGDHDEY